MNRPRNNRKAILRLEAAGDIGKAKFARGRLTDLGKHRLWSAGAAWSARGPRLGHCMPYAGGCDEPMLVGVGIELHAAPQPKF